MSTTRDAFRRGVIDVLPVMLGVVPFGLIAGIAAVEAGLGLAEALGFSVIYFAGASQLAALDLIGRDATALAAIATAAIINARMLMYGASLAPQLAHLPLRQRIGAAYLLVDQVYALSVVRWGREPTMPRLPYYLGTALPLWVGWQFFTAVGALAGTAVPESVPLGFTVPLVFLALLVPAMHDRPTVAAGVVAGVVATVAAPLPAHSGMPLAAVAGIAAGVVVARGRRPDGAPA